MKHMLRLNAVMNNSKIKFIKPLICAIIILQSCGRRVNPMVYLRCQAPLQRYTFSMDSKPFLGLQKAYLNWPESSKETASKFYCYRSHKTAAESIFNSPVLRQVCFGFDKEGHRVRVEVTEEQSKSSTVALMWKNWWERKDLVRLLHCS